MYDIQKSVSSYYASTVSTDDAGSEVRTFLSRSQRLNASLTSEISDHDTYSRLIESSTDSSAQLMRAIKYARNVIEHTSHIISPKTDALIGGGRRFREYPVWDDIPEAIHAQLRKRTQQLKLSYDAVLSGQSVIDTMFAVLRFFARVSPSIIHRDSHGEWTGFPLMNQDSVPDPLHPEEPLETDAAWDWLNTRIPNGDTRVVCGQFKMNEVNYWAGLTFVGRYSFTPFVETELQIARDMQAGFTYRQGDVERNVSDRSSEFSDWGCTNVLFSMNEINVWAHPVERFGYQQNWFTIFPEDYWRRLVRFENYHSFATLAYCIRRKHRLNAQMPPLFK